MSSMLELEKPACTSGWPGEEMGTQATHKGKRKPEDVGSLDLIIGLEHI